MKTTDAIKIFLLSVMALVAEVILFFIITFTMAVGDTPKSTMDGVAKFFGWLGFITAFIGVGSLALVLIGFIIRRLKELGEFVGIKVVKEEKSQKTKTKR